MNDKMGTLSGSGKFREDTSAGDLNFSDTSERILKQSPHDVHGNSGLGKEERH